MSRKGTKILVLFALGMMFATTGCNDLADLVDMGAGSEAQFLCSNVFISGRSPQSVFDQEGNLGERMGDLGAVVESLMDCTVDFEDQSATCGILGVERKSVYREHLGCTLLYGRRAGEVPIYEAGLRAQETGDLTPSPPGQELLDWPTGEVLSGVIPPEVDTVQLEAILDEAFSEPDPGNLRRTRGVVIVYDGQLVAERYAEAEGYTMLTPHYGWSMTKSVTCSLVGVLVRQGRLVVEAPAPIETTGEETSAPSIRDSLRALLSWAPADAEADGCATCATGGAGAAQLRPIHGGTGRLVALRRGARGDGRRHQRADARSITQDQIVCDHRRRVYSWRRFLDGVKDLERVGECEVGLGTHQEVAPGQYLRIRNQDHPGSGCPRFFHVLRVVEEAQVLGLSSIERSDARDIESPITDEVDPEFRGEVRKAHAHTHSRPVSSICLTGRC